MLIYDFFTPRSFPPLSLSFPVASTLSLFHPLPYNETLIYLSIPPSPNPYISFNLPFSPSLSFSFIRLLSLFHSHTQQLTSFLHAQIPPLSLDHFSERQVLTPSECSCSDHSAIFSMNNVFITYFSSWFPFLSPFPARDTENSSPPANKAASPHCTPVFSRRVILSPSVELR